MNYTWYLHVVLHIFVTTSDCLHLKGTWNSQNAFYFFLSKFGFQKTTAHAATASQTSGYIYGNITSTSTSGSGLTLVLVDSEFFLDYYGNRTKFPRSQACVRMFRKINHAAFDSRCYPKGPEDFLRRIPCPLNQLCPDEDNPHNVIPGYQFTYTIQDLRKPRFWYLSFVACHLNSTDASTPPSCKWQHQVAPFLVDYDIWLVNGHPFTKHVNPFEHQFSFEQHDVFEIYATFLLLCCILIPLWTYAYRKQRHKLTQLFSVCIFLETAGILLNFIHTFKFAFDGVGVYWLHVAGDAIDSLAECLLVLLLLVIAKGWAITTRGLGGKVPLFIIWGGYTAVNTALFIWNLTELDIVSNMEEWDTVPGYIMLGVRIAVMFWFLFELRRTSVRETRLERLQFFQHFGAGFLVWFIYQPILAVISTQVSALWKRKTTLSMTYSADFLAFAALVHLLWPSRTVLNFVEKVTPLPPDEMEVAVLLESEPTFREIVRSEDSPSGSDSREGSSKVMANGGPGHRAAAAQRAKVSRKKTSQKEDKTSLIDYDDFSDYDSL